VAAVVVAAIGALALAIGGILSLSAGLVVIATVLGVVVGWLVRGTVGDRAAAGLVAVGVALGGVAIGQVLLWCAALLEGGVLGPLDYLGQTFGILVPAQFVMCGLGAWLAAR
jgi:hypothetical protein